MIAIMVTKLGAKLESNLSADKCHIFYKL